MKTIVNYAIVVPIKLLVMIIAIPICVAMNLAGDGDKADGLMGSLLDWRFE